MTKKPPVKDRDPRINIAFYDDNLEFCRVMAQTSHQSVTRYVNCLINQEKEKHDKTEWKSPAANKKNKK